MNIIKSGQWKINTKGPNSAVNPDYPFIFDPFEI